RHFVFFRFIVGALNRTNVPVVGCLRIRRAERERSLQRGLLRLPVNRIAELYAIAAVACAESHGFYELGAFGFARDLHCNPYRTIFHHTHFRRTANESARRLLLVGPIHVPRRPVEWCFSLEREARGSGEQFLVYLLVEA